MCDIVLTKCILQKPCRTDIYYVWQCRWFHCQLTKECGSGLCDIRYSYVCRSYSEKSGSSSFVTWSSWSVISSKTYQKSMMKLLMTKFKVRILSAVIRKLTWLIKEDIKKFLNESTNRNRCNFLVKVITIILKLEFNHLKTKEQ